MDQTGVRINVPPPSVMKNEIVVSGEKDGVQQAVTSIMKIYDEKVKLFFISLGLLVELCDYTLYYKNAFAFYFAFKTHIKLIF